MRPFIPAFGGGELADRTPNYEDGEDPASLNPHIAHSRRRGVVSRVGGMTSSTSRGPHAWRPWQGSGLRGAHAQSRVVA